ncbi:MAG: hypothetical protein AAFX85_16220, partial [Pseudomonadota bacterium]
DVHHAPDLVGRLVEILEEEVLLAVPDYPAHAQGECQPVALPAGVDTESPAAPDDEQETAPTQRPFASALRDLRKKQND